MEIKILSVGDEYSGNAQRYLSKIARCDGLDITVGNLCMKDSTLEKHWNAVNGDLPVYSFEYFADGSVRSDTYEEFSFTKGLGWDDWNYVTLQQGGETAGISDSFFPYICDITNTIKEKLPGASLILNETWAFQQDCTAEEFSLYNNSQSKMSEMIRNSYIAAAEKTGISIIFPVNEAWQNVRSTSIGDNLTVDGRHGNRMGEFLTSAVWYEILTGNDVSKNTYRLPFVPGERVDILKDIAHSIGSKYSLRKQ